jgi:hypothetical protein
VSKRSAKITSILYNAIAVIYWFVTSYNNSTGTIVGIPAWVFASVGLLVIYIPEGYVCYRILKASNPKERKNAIDDKDK